MVCGTEYQEEEPDGPTVDGAELNSRTRSAKRHYRTIHLRGQPVRDCHSVTNSGRSGLLPVENVLGHYEVDDKKPLCPGIDMEMIRKYLR